MEEHPDHIQVNNRTFVRVQEVSHTKKAIQVARIIEALQDAPGHPLEFDQLCTDAGAKWPQDIQSALFALEFTENVDIYQESQDAGKRGKTYLVWTGPTDPTSASSD